MKYFDTIVQILRKPFPDEENWFSYLRTLTILSVFITFFLYIFQPFGLSMLKSNTFLICLGFGSMTFAGSVLYEVTVSQLLKLFGLREHWTFGKWILNFLGIMVFISFANFIFARLVLFGFIQWDLFPSMLYGTFMIGIIPIIVLGGISMVKQEKKYQGIAEEINKVKKTISVINEKGIATVFDIPSHQIKFIEALQNYVKIGYVNTEGDLKIRTERSTLKEVLETTEGSSIVKCHRSYLVNTNSIASTSGNAQGLLLLLSDCDKIIPVSRTYVPLFRSH